MAQLGGLQEQGPSKKVGENVARSGNGVELVKQNFSFLLEEGIVTMHPEEQLGSGSLNAQ